MEHINTTEGLLQIYPNQENPWNHRRICDQYHAIRKVLSTAVLIRIRPKLKNSYLSQSKRSQTKPQHIRHSMDSSNS